MSSSRIFCFAFCVNNWKFEGSPSHKEWRQKQVLVNMLQAIMMQSWSGDLFWINLREFYAAMVSCMNSSQPLSLKYWCTDLSLKWELFEFFKIYRERERNRAVRKLKAGINHGTPNSKFTFLGSNLSQTLPHSIFPESVWLFNSRWFAVYWTLQIYELLQGLHLEFTAHLFPFSCTFQFLSCCI